MKPTNRNILSFVPLILQFLAMTSAYAMTSFLSQSVALLVKEYERGIFPPPSLLLANHPGPAKMIVVGLFAISAVCFFVSRSRMKDESDRLAFQGAVFAIVWWLGSAYSAAVIMAALVAYTGLDPVQ